MPNDTEASLPPKRTLALGETGLEHRGIHIVKQPRWNIFCDRCDWSTEHWDKAAALFAARNHAEGCPGAN